MGRFFFTGLVGKGGMKSWLLCDGDTSRIGGTIRDIESVLEGFCSGGSYVGLDEKREYVVLISMLLELCT